MSELCAVCQLSFGSPADLLDHRRTAHRGSEATATLRTNPEAHRPGLVCGLCSRRFATPELLAEHLNRPHRTAERRAWTRSAPG